VERKIAMGDARTLNPDDISVPSNYKIEVFAEG
jgi:hypothetical protein